MHCGLYFSLQYSQYPTKDSSSSVSRMSIDLSVKLKAKTLHKSIVSSEPYFEPIFGLENVLVAFSVTSTPMVVSQSLFASFGHCIKTRYHRFLHWKICLYATGEMKGVEFFLFNIKEICHAGSYIYLKLEELRFCSPLSQNG